jgi:hypothetical protein
LSYFLKYKKAMLKYELLPYFGLADIQKMLQLSKTSKDMTKEAYKENDTAMMRLIMLT